MKAIGHILLAAVLGLGTLIQAEETAQSPAVLLQEALYQEQTAGDLDKAIELYGQVLTQAAEVEQLAARATYQLGLCHLKIGDETAAADYFQKAVSSYPGQISVVKKAQTQLEKLSPTSNLILFEKLPEDVLLSTANLYGQIATKAGMKNLYANSHIHYVDTDFIDYSGGCGYFTNQLGTPLTQKVRLSGTTNPDLLYYDIAGRKMNIQIIPNEEQPGYYHVYWTPTEPLPPGQIYMYGWCSPDSQRLPMLSNMASEISERNRMLTMQNYFGDHAFEVFFLVLPAGLSIAETSEPWTDEQSVGDYTIYAWEKEVQSDENHLVTAYLSKKHNVQTWVEDFFRNNYRDITARKTIEWGEPVIHDNGNISIRYKYEATIWDKDIIIENKVWTFDAQGDLISVRKVGAEDIYSFAGAQALVEDFFANNYRDITERKTIEWGQPIKHENGDVSIRYKYEATIWDEDTIIQNKLWTFNKNGKLVSVKDADLDSNP